MQEIVNVYHSSLSYPKTTYRLHITNLFIVDQFGKPPCLFHRWMMRLFFGFKIEVLND